MKKILQSCHSLHCGSNASRSINHKFTTSSGSIPIEGSLPPKYSEIRICTLGMRVDPPTRTISYTSLLLTSASSITFPTSASVFLNRSLFNSSKRARVKVRVDGGLAFSEGVEDVEVFCLVIRGLLPRTSRTSASCFEDFIAILVRRINSFEELVKA